MEGARMRLNLHAPATGEADALSADHYAMLANRSVYQNRVVEPRRGIDVLKPGSSNSKLGGSVTKGAWAGSPIFSLTLEERATCPSSCHMLASCYGNSMSFAARYRHGPELERAIENEVLYRARRNPDGLVIRLHILGDFYSVDYVGLWASLLRRTESLRVFGYTAWPEDSAIGRSILRLPWPRFAIRFSSADRGPRRAVTLRSAAEAAGKKNLIVCPVETGRARSCGTCGLCWSPAAKKKTIGFIVHGQNRSRKTKG